MSTETISGRLPKHIHDLLVKQVGPRQKKSQIVNRYVMEGVLSGAFPGVSFRDACHGREAYVSGHRLGVWEVAEMRREFGSVEAVAEHLGWPALLVKKALKYAAAFPAEIKSAAEAETR